MQNPSGMGRPARPSAARLPAFGPTRSTSSAAGSVVGKMDCSMASFTLLFARQQGNSGERRYCGPASRITRGDPGRWILATLLFQELGVARHRVDDGNLFDRETRNELDPILV